MINLEIAVHHRLLVVIASAFPCLIALGCASPSGITPYGRDSYVVAVEDIWGATAPAKLQIQAAQRANAFCTGQGKVMRVRNATQDGVSGWTGTSSSLVFSCIRDDDRENTRPNLRRDPDTIIEHRGRYE